MTNDGTTPVPVEPKLEELLASSLFSLSGKTVLVTGGSSGLGETLALTMAGAGATVIATARRMDRLERLAAKHPAIVPIACDVSSKSELAALVSQVHQRGQLDVLINCAGTIGDVVAAENETAEQVAHTLDVNLLAPFALCQAFAPEMKKAGNGSIINIASISAVVGIGRIPQASYVMSKAGLVGLTRELAVQWGRFGIRVNSIACGFFLSEITVPMFASPKMAEWVRSRQPLQFTGLPGDFAGMVLLLASRSGRFITGQTYAVDGGWTAP